MALEEQRPAPTREQMGMYIEAASQTVKTLNAQLDAALDTLSKLGELWKDRIDG